MTGYLSTTDTIEFAKLHIPGKGRHRQLKVREPITVWDILFALVLDTYIGVLIVFPYFY